MSNPSDSEVLELSRLGPFEALLSGGVDDFYGSTWHAILCRSAEGPWVCGLACTSGEPPNRFDGPAPMRLANGGELFHYLAEHWPKSSGERLVPGEMECLAARLCGIDRLLGEEFSRTLVTNPIAAPVPEKPRRIRYKLRIDSLEGIRERLCEAESWVSGEKKALKLLHERARAEQSLRCGQDLPPGPHERLEIELFGDPRRMMSEDETLGCGFYASLMDGPGVCFFSLAGIHCSDRLHDAVWNDKNWHTLLDECDEASCEVVGEQDDRPGMSDVFYWVCVRDPVNLARQLREFIVSRA